MFKRSKQVQTDRPKRPGQILLWPGVVAVLVQWLVRFIIPMAVPDAISIGVFGGLIFGLVIIVWWAFFSRAPRIERWGAVVLMIVAMFVTSKVIHESIETAGRGMIFYIYAVPVLCLAFVIWAVASRRLAVGPRRLTMVVTILLACGGWTFLRLDGINGYGGSDFNWRWAETPEERLLAMEGKEQMVSTSVPVADETGVDWPGFRGPDRDGHIYSTQIETDWNTFPPTELWRRPVGPGCSSFAVYGDLLYTQEQRGDNEIVSCYKVTTGEAVWIHNDETRFWDSHAGAGPRATPTFSDGRLYTFGATGILNVLDAQDGAVIWSRNAASETDAMHSGWGFTSSPLVVDDVVIVAIAGVLVAYDLSTGDPRWFGPDGGTGYSSPHPVTIDGVPQILLMSETGTTSVAPTDGTLLWQYPWPEERIVQPALTASGDLLLSMGAGKGMRRITVTSGPDGWRTEERWTSVGLKPYFNDFVVHKGHAFGIYGPSLACIEIEEGIRKWKSGRDGGQLLLLADQDLLLVLSVDGELALVAADPEQFTELARFHAIEGKTWNHPALIGDILLVRNAEEMVAFRLSLRTRSD